MHSDTLKLIFSYIDNIVISIELNVNRPTTSTHS